MPHKLNVIGQCGKGLFVSPRKVREELMKLGDGITLYLADMWIYRYLPNRPFKYRRAASLVIRIAAHDDIPELCWEAASCIGIKTKEEAATHYAGIIKDLMHVNPDDLMRQRDELWKRNKFLRPLQKARYYPVYQEDKNIEPDTSYYTNHYSDFGKGRTR